MENIVNTVKVYPLVRKMFLGVAFISEIATVASWHYVPLCCTGISLVLSVFIINIQRLE